MTSDFVNRQFQRSILLWINSVSKDNDYCLFDFCFPKTLHVILGLYFPVTSTDAFESHTLEVITESDPGSTNVSVDTDLLQLQVDVLMADVTRLIMAFEYNASERTVILRLSTIVRSLSIERLVLYNEEKQLLLVLELLFLMIIRIAKDTGATKTLRNLPSHHIESISIYLDAVSGDMEDEDYVELKLEEHRREINCQLAHMSMKLDQEQESSKAIIEELADENNELRDAVEQLQKAYSEQELEITKWERQLIQSAFLKVSDLQVRAS